MTNKYYYTKLDNNCQEIYNDILSAWEAHNPNPSFKMSPQINNNNIQKILEYIRFDNPSLFYVDLSRVALSCSFTSATVQSNFLYNERQIADLEKQLGAIIAGVLSSHNFNALDKFHKELVLHDYLVKNVSYTVGGDTSETTSVAGALISGRAVCEGYAKAFKMLCDRAGLSCIFVSGKATPYNRAEEPHAWNIVKFDGVCAHVDVTWDNTTKGNSDTCYDHVNLTDDDTAKDHVWDRSLFPACTSPQNNYYVKNGQCVSKRSEFKDYVASQAKQGKKTISVRIAGKETTGEVIMNLAHEALRGITNSPMGLRYNPKRGTATISLN